MYKLRFTAHFRQRYEKLTKRDEKLGRRIQKALRLLATNPRHPSLKTHKAESKNFGIVLSSWVIGDLRVEWRFSRKEEITMLVLGLGGHSGKYKVYK